MKKILTIIMVAFLICGVESLNSIEAIAADVPASVEVAEQPQFLPKDENGCEYIPEPYDIWKVKLHDENGNPYTDITSEVDRANGIRRLVLKTESRVNGILIIDRKIVHYAVVNKTWNAKVVE